MRTLSMCGAVAMLVAAGAAPTAAPQQYPGQMTQGRVWVQNRGEGEAVPVDLANASGKPIRVIVMHGETPWNGANPVAVRPVRQTFEYRTIMVRRTDDPAAVLAPAGLEGWEITGVTWEGTDGTKLLLKRQR